jgi:hypothetical protein
MGATNIDGRLLMALRTGSVCRIELAPGERAPFALIVPVGGALCGGYGGNAKCKNGKYRKTHRKLLAEQQVVVLENSIPSTQEWETNET